MPAAGEGPDHVDRREEGELDIEATVESVLYRGDTTAAEPFAVISARPRGGASFVAAGPIPALDRGMAVRLLGRWQEHPKHGRRFAVRHAFAIPPKSVAGIERFLASGLVRGVGPVLAKRIVGAFGGTTLDVLEREPERVAALPGIGPRRATAISLALGEQRGVRDLLIFLRGYDVPTGVALRIHKAWGNDAIARIEQNPWRLATDISGIGFRTADGVARQLGLPAESVNRAAAAILHALGEARAAGHVLVLRDRLIEATRELLTPVESAPIAAAIVVPFDDALAELVAARRVVVEDEAVYTTRLHEQEVELARRLRKLAGRAVRELPTNHEGDLTAFEESNTITLAPPQRDAIRLALSAPLLVVTGGPGTGKTTLVRAVVALGTRAGLRIALAAPTGRAAKRLAEASGHAATTLHRLLEIDPETGGFLRREGNSLDTDLVILDEASMLDVPLADSVLAAIGARTRLVLVGDSDQLPSVGPGSVLADTIASAIAPVVRLTRIFRQGGGSRIVDGAHRVLAGLMPVAAESLDEPNADYFFIDRDNPVEAREIIERLVTERIPARFGFDPRADIQVLAPMHRGELGTTTLNQALQAKLNPSGRPIPASRGLRVGDKVLQTRNNYELKIFNGDLGRIVAFDAEEGIVEVAVDDAVVKVRPHEREDLSLAYACSIHKSQGSEYPCVVLALHTQHYLMLERNLLYTALTRAKRLAVLVGNRRALAMAVKTSRSVARQGRLRERLVGVPGGA